VKVVVLKQFSPTEAQDFGMSTTAQQLVAEAPGALLCLREGLSDGSRGELAIYPDGEAGEG
jgi:hypothetical protein